MSDDILIIFSVIKQVDREAGFLREERTKCIKVTFTPRVIIIITLIIISNNIIVLLIMLFINIEIIIEI